MDNEPPTPLINSAGLANHQNRTVRVFGSIKRIEQAQSVFMLTTSDQGVVEVRLAPESNVINMEAGSMVEVLAKVDDKGETLKELVTYQLSDNLNLELVDKCVQIFPHYPALFEVTEQPNRDMDEGY